MNTAKTKKNILTQNEMLSALSWATEVPKAKIKAVMQKLTEIIRDELNEKRVVRFFGFGKFKLVHAKARTGINPLTKKSIRIPARTRVKFSVARSYANFVLNPDAAVKVRKAPRPSVAKAVSKPKPAAKKPKAKRTGKKPAKKAR